MTEKLQNRFRMHTNLQNGELFRAIEMTCFILDRSVQNLQYNITYENTIHNLFYITLTTKYTEDLLPMRLRSCSQIIGLICDTNTLVHILKLWSYLRYAFRNTMDYYINSSHQKDNDLAMTRVGYNFNVISLIHKYRLLHYRMKHLMGSAERRYIKFVQIICTNFMFDTHILIPHPTV